jgi:phage gp46-like protein
MAKDPARFGTDLRLLPDLIRGNDREPGNDLHTMRREITNQFDLEPVSGVENLQQALLMRFLTPVGELTDLGHAEYGSRLFELIGERNIETTHNRAKLYVLLALGQEPRVKKVQSVRVSANKVERTQMDIEVTLVATDEDTPLNFVFPFFLG